MTKPILIERFADNGEHSHWDLINVDTGETLWTGNTKQNSQDDISDFKHILIAYGCKHIGLNQAYTTKPINARKSP